MATFDAATRRTNEPQQREEEAKQHDAAPQQSSYAAPAFPAPEPHYRSAAAAASSSAGLSAQHDALSLKALTQRFYVWFKDSGMLAALQTQFRAQIIQQIPRRHLMTSGGAAVAASGDASLLSLRSTKDQTLLQRATNSLIMEYFREFDYPFALSIFGPESGSVGAANATLTTEDILAVLRLQTKSNGSSGAGTSSHEWIAKRIRKAINDDGDDEEGATKENRSLARSAGRASKPDRSRFPKRSLLALLLDSVAAQPPPPLALDFSCQTDPDTGSKDALSIDSKFREIDRAYLGKQIEDSSMLFPQLQEKMLRFEREQAERFALEMEVEKKRFADSEGVRIRAEERARYRADEERLRKELRKETEAHVSRLRQETSDVISKYQSKERELSDSNFRERQQLQENMNLLHAREVEMARKRDVMERAQSLAEAKIKESDRILLARSTELDYLSNNLQSKISEEKKRVRTEWEQQVLKRDELIESLSETLKSVESKLARKTGELDNAIKLMDEYEREMNSSSTGRKLGETKLVELQHQLSLAQTQLADTETRRAKLEEQLLAATVKEQVCFHHVAELGALRARINSQAEEFEAAMRSARENHGQDLEAERQQAQQALLAGHTAASNLVAQWKSSYVELAQELERRRSEEERAKQALEEESLVTRELKREVAALRAGLANTGAGFHIAALPSAAPSAAPFLPGLSELHKRVGAYAPEYPALSAAASTAVSSPGAYESISSSSAFQSSLPPVAAASVVSPSSAAAPSTTIPASVQSAANTLDAEFFTREQALELETQALSHSVGMHAARERIDTESERRERAKEQSVQAATQRHMQLTSVARDFALSQVLPSTAATNVVASESEAAFTASSVARDRDAASQREAYLKLAATEESDRRAKQASDALALRHKALEWEQDKLEQDRRAAAQQQQAAADEQRAKSAEAQRAEDEVARQRQAQQASTDAAAAADAARVAAAAAAEAEARRSAATVTFAPTSLPPVAASESSDSTVASYDAQSEEELAAKLRADREQRERVERDREARLARRMEERAAQARLAPIAATPVLAPAPASDPEDSAARQKAEADRAVRELEAEKEARRAVLREEERLRRERAEREAAEQEAQAQRQAEADAAAAAAAAASYSAPAATAAEAAVDEVPYDEAATAAYWATQGYWDEATGGWIAYTEEQKTQMREYADYEAAQQQQQQQHASAGAYAAPTDAAQPAPDSAYAAPALPADPYDDGISEASAEISAPQSDAEF